MEGESAGATRLSLSVPLPTDQWAFTVENHRGFTCKQTAQKKKVCLIVFNNIIHMSGHPEQMTRMLKMDSDGVSSRCQSQRTWLWVTVTAAHRETDNTGRARQTPDHQCRQLLRCNESWENCIEPPVLHRADNPKTPLRFFQRSHACHFGLGQPQKHPPKEN